MTNEFLITTRGFKLIFKLQNFRGAIFHWALLRPTCYVVNTQESNFILLLVQQEESFSSYVQRQKKESAQFKLIPQN